MKANNFIQIIKIPLKYKLLLSVGTGVILSIPPNFMRNFLNITVDGIIRTLIGTVFIFSMTVLLTEIIMNVFKYIGKNLTAISEKKKLEKQLIKKKEEKAETVRRKTEELLKEVDNLSNDELIYLTTFVDQKKEFLDMPLNDGIVNTLSQKGEIERVSEISSRLMMFSYKINPCIYHKILNTKSLQRRGNPAAW